MIVIRGGVGGGGVLGGASRRGELIVESVGGTPLEGVVDLELVVVLTGWWSVGVGLHADALEWVLSARNGRSLPSLDSSHSGEEVCFQSTYHMDRSVQTCCRPLLCLPCYFPLWVVSVFEQ